MTLDALTPAFGSTRAKVQRIGAHVLSRARHAVTGRIDLAPTPGGIGTLAFGPDHRVLRLSGELLVVETTGDQPATACMTVSGNSLAALAEFAGVDLDSDYTAGADTPELGDVDGALQLDGRSVELLGAWFAVGMQVLVAAITGAAEPTRARIWPEHFDLGIDVACAGSRVNLGASAGDSFHEAPYLYVAPWEPSRPGPADFWNAPFGAVLGYESLRDQDGIAHGVDFIAEGLGHLGAR